jgi:hypothetical protein
MAFENYYFNVSMSYSCEKEPSGETRSDCDQAAEILENGQVVLPPDATDIEGPVDVDEDRGLLSSLYPESDTTTDGFYPLPCESSIGGTLPPEVNEPPTQEETETEQFLENFETTEGPKVVEDLTIKDGLKKFNPIAAPNIIPGQCLIVATTPANTVRIEPKPCDDRAFLRHDQPFEGRDIIYVHGLAMEHLKKWMSGDEKAHKLWPDDKSEFLDKDGYFRKYAENYWRDHIRENLIDPDNFLDSRAGWQWTAADPEPRYNPKSNRYLIIAWSSNQTLEYAQHALLEQIRLAIMDNVNVVTPWSYPVSQRMPFCANGCIIISHSTGGLVVSTALARAAEGDFGPDAVKIPRYIRTHVAFDGAMAGSRLATVAMAIGLVAAAPQAVCTLFKEIFTNGGCGQDMSFVTRSILRDLMPFVAQGVWGRKVGASPVPTLTVAGGHPMGNSFGVTKILLPGLDDGVVSMNSSCGNPNPVYPHLLAPSGILVSSETQAFDFSEKPGLLLRAIKNFISHKHLMDGAVPGTFIANSPTYLAGACTPYLSPTGMVMPVKYALKYTPWSTRSRYGNHFSFIQGSLDHYYDGGSDDRNTWPSARGEPASTIRHYLQALGPNIEESSAITDKRIFRKFSDGTYLVHPSFANMREVVRGRYIRFKLFKKKHTIWIWKRTYHLLDKWEQKQSSHYVYEFVGRR